jgi:hypothetical protein
MAAHGHSQRAYCAQLCGDWLAAGSTSGAVALYDVRRAAKVAEVAGAHAGGTFSCHLVGERLVTGGEDGVVLAWHVARLAAAGAEEVQADVQGQRRQQAQEGRQHSGCIYSVRQGDDWRVASAGAEGRLVVWRQGTGGRAAGCGLQAAAGPAVGPSAGAGAGSSRPRCPPAFQEAPARSVHALHHPQVLPARPPACSPAPATGPRSMATPSWRRPCSRARRCWVRR